MEQIKVTYYGYIYVLTSPSGKHYVGQSWNVESRWNCYLKRYGKNQPKLYNALTYYGPENFVFYIIDCASTQELLDKKEAYWISSYDSINSGYNNREGGRFGQISTKPKNEEISIRVDDNEKEIIEAKAKSFGFKNISDYSRYVLSNAELFATVDISIKSEN